MHYFVYILSNFTNSTIYTGVTNDLVRRVYEHRHDIDPKSFRARYKTHKLVYFEDTPDVRAAIEREKQIKSWSRAKKESVDGRKKSNVAGSISGDSAVKIATAPAEPRNDTLFHRFS